MAIDVFNALSSPVRRDLLDRIRRQPQPVKALAAGSHLRRPAISEHLKVLRDAGLVREEQRGREHYYHLDPRPLLELEAWLRPFELFWRDRFDDLRDALAADEADQEEENAQQ